MGNHNRKKTKNKRTITKVPKTKITTEVSKTEITTEVPAENKKQKITRLKFAFLFIFAGFFGNKLFSPICWFFIESKRLIPLKYIDNTFLFIFYWICFAIYGAIAVIVVKHKNKENLRKEALLNQDSDTSSPVTVFESANSDQTKEISLADERNTKEFDDNEIDDLYLTSSETISLIPKEVSSSVSSEQADKSMRTDKKWWVLSDLGYIVTGFFIITIPAVLLFIASSDPYEYYEHYDGLTQKWLQTKQLASSTVSMLLAAIVIFVLGILWIVLSVKENQKIEVKTNASNIKKASKDIKYLEANDKNISSLSSEVTMEEIRRSNQTVKRQQNKKKKLNSKKRKR